MKRVNPRGAAAPMTRGRAGSLAQKNGKPHGKAMPAIAISTCRNHPFSRSKKQGLSWSDTPMLKAGRGL